MRAMFVHIGLGCTSFDARESLGIVHSAELAQIFSESEMIWVVFGVGLDSTCV